MFSQRCCGNNNNEQTVMFSVVSTYMWGQKKIVMWGKSSVGMAFMGGVTNCSELQLSVWWTFQLSFVESLEIAQQLRPTIRT